MRRETLRVGKIRNPSVAEGHSNFRFSSFQARVRVSVCVRRPEPRNVCVCVRATKSERLKRTVPCSVEWTVSRVSLFLLRDLIWCVIFFSREEESKARAKL